MTGAKAQRETPGEAQEKDKAQEQGRPDAAELQTCREIFVEAAGGEDSKGEHSKGRGRKRQAGGDEPQLQSSAEQDVAKRAKKKKTAARGPSGKAKQRADAGDKDAKTGEDEGNSDGETLDAAIARLRELQAKQFSRNDDPEHFDPDNPDATLQSVWERHLGAAARRRLEIQFRTSLPHAQRGFLNSYLAKTIVMLQRTRKSE